MAQLEEIYRTNLRFQIGVLMDRLRSKATPTKKVILYLEASLQEQYLNLAELCSEIFGALVPEEQNDILFEVIFLKIHFEFDEIPYLNSEDLLEGSYTHFRLVRDVRAPSYDFDVKTGLLVDYCRFMHRTSLYLQKYSSVEGMNGEHNVYIIYVNIWTGKLIVRAFRKGEYSPEDDKDAAEYILSVKIYDIDLSCMNRNDDEEYLRNTFQVGSSLRFFRKKLEYLPYLTLDAGTTSFYFSEGINRLHVDMS